MLFFILLSCSTSTMVFCHFSISGLDGWCDGGVGKQGDDGGGCATRSERSERVENPGTYVTE